MIALRFDSDEVRRDCCDLARMRRRWGEVVARQISHRLQQLDAMTSLNDLGFLPFRSTVSGRSIELAVTDHVSLEIEAIHSVEGEEERMTTLVIRGLHARAMTARSS